MSYKIGRRFEYHVVYKLKEFGIEAKRVTLSGKKSEFYPACDIIIKIRNKELKGKLKTVKKKKYVSIPIKDFEELSINIIDFLCIGFFRSSPFFIVNDFKDIETLEKIGKKFISFSKKDVKELPKNIFIKELNKKFLLIDIKEFVERLKNLERAQELPL